MMTRMGEACPMAGGKGAGMGMVWARAAACRT